MIVLMKIKVMKNSNYNMNNSNRMWSGLILLIIGVAFFLRNFGVALPHWVFSWHTILLVIGLAVGAKRDFKGGGWLAMVLLGGYFTLQDMADLDLSRYSFALLLVAVGAYMILKPSRWNKDKWEKKKPDFNLTDTPPNDAEKDRTYIPGENDHVDSINLFSHSKHQVYSKNFIGGDVVTIFGGCDLNLTQADLQDTVILDVVAIFGGIKIIVPPTWIVKSEVTAVFGGLDDKRSVLSDSTSSKMIIIKGVALFGGVDIRNF
jgi:predicted membrane protein